MRVAMFLALSMCASGAAAEKPKAGHDFEKRSQRMLRLIVEGRADEGLREMSDDPLIQDIVPIAARDSLAQAHKELLASGGPILSFERSFLRCWTPRLCGEIYIGHTARGFVAYKYTWTRPQERWLLSGFSFDTNVGAALQEPEVALWGPATSAPAR